MGRIIGCVFARDSAFNLEDEGPGAGRGGGAPSDIDRRLLRGPRHEIQRMVEAVFSSIDVYFNLSLLVIL